MRIIALADIHFKPGYEEKLQSLVQTIGQADLLLLAGDITHFGTDKELETVLNTLSPISSQLRAVPGNCDTEGISRGLKERGIGIEGKAFACDLCVVQGLGGVPPWRKMDYGFSEPQITEILQQGQIQRNELLQSAGKPLAKILLTHVPPYNTRADKAMYMKHVGSTALAKFINDDTLDLCICGHIHECVGLSMVKNTQLVNCGPARRGYYVDITISENPESSSGLDVKVAAKRKSDRFWG